MLTYLQSRVTLGHAKNGGVGNFPLLAEKDLDNFAVLKPILFRTLTKKRRFERKWKWKLIFFLSFFSVRVKFVSRFFFLVRPYVRVGSNSFTTLDLDSLGNDLMYFFSFMISSDIIFVR